MRELGLGLAGRFGTIVASVKENDIAMNEYSIQHDYDKRFPLWHCILYYLGWYEKSGNKCL